MSDSTEITLAAHGWTLECESPFEIRHNASNSFASGMAAHLVVAHLQADQPAAEDPPLCASSALDRMNELRQLCDRVGTLIELTESSKAVDPWRTVFGLVFSPVIAGRVRELCRSLGLGFDYLDPDSSYEDDVRAFAAGLVEFKKELEHLMPAFE